ncbi:N-acetylglucosamine-6-phosphate deacetylase [Streptomyces durbertensis]|uniref:N-acetylglucosamine-6-phosphate deacetylase n=1 Tax=Streptomyces durbertensis TaxID=2448886 RepID=A0ABR6EHL5_9ACTN|nr:N-acetylglucosamine-6-phosphate deacetylase [Streptomyces durbertensis]MBB1244763.1 N-acetylglucosamine-6-phosphate deacetylase [Streptomyces durbertensis]
MPESGRLLLAGARVVTPEGVLDGGRVVVEGGRIAEVTPPPAGPEHAAASATADPAAHDRVPADPAAHDLTGYWLVPGFVDIHNHGGGGGSFTSGSAEDVLTGVRTHREHGSTTVVGSMVTGELDDLARQASLLSELVEQGDLAGVHFEGPFISPCRKGAHAEHLLRDPDPADVRKLLDAARGTAVMCTLATELPGGISSVRLLAEHGVIAAVGHTDAGYDQTREAIEAGATVATHLFNAMPALQHRAPGPVTALLEDDRVTVELINDGVHLHPAVLELAVRAAGVDRVAFVTDAMDAAGFGDGSYRLGALDVTVSDGVARLADGTIAGSTLTLDTALRRAVTVDGLPVEDAVRALSTTPARLLGRSDRIGAILPGLDADLVVLDEDLRVRGVLRKGEWVVDPTA